MRAGAAALGGLLAAGLAGWAPAAAQEEPSASPICRAAEAFDPADSELLDVAHVEVAEDCVAGRWAVTLDLASGTIADLLVVGIYADTDGITTNGCEGFDVAVVGNQQSASVQRLAGCAGHRVGIGSATVREVDDGAIEVVVDSATLGTRTGPVRVYAAVDGRSGRTDNVPDFGALTVPEQGGARPTTFPNGRCDIPLDETARSHSVERLYRAYFLRQPDAAGLEFWASRLRDGRLCLTEISQAFTGSDEFHATYGDLGDPEFVRLVYVNVLEREPDPEGYAYWADQLTNRLLPRGTMMVGFSESPEFRARTGLA